MTKTKPMTEFNWGKKFTELQEKQGKLGTQKALISRSFIAHAIDQATSKAREVTGETSDGYHTFNELYEFRKLYNAALFNEWTAQGKYDVHKSKRHSSGEECFGGGWFIVVAELPTGQISNHYELKDWDLFTCESRELPNTWDGHTEKDVLVRLQSLIQKDK